MSKKKRSIMDGYFDEPKTPVEINPFVELVDRANNHLINTRANLLNADKKSAFKESESKRGLNGVENKVTVSERRPEQGLNSVQSESKRGLNGVENKVTVSERRPEQGLNSVQSESKRGLNGVENLDSNLLIGREKQLLEFLVFECQRIGSLQTEPLTIERIKESLNASTDAVKTAIKRLASKGFIIRGFRKNGRSGWVQYQVLKAVYERVLFSQTVSERSLNRVETVSERRPEQGSKQGPNTPYSSSNNINIITTTEPPTFSAEIILPNNLARFGISKTNLQKLVDDRVCTLELVQKSLEALSYDVEHGKTGNLAAILFGVLRSGKEYISQKYSESLQQELDQELTRIQASQDHQKQLLEIRLQEKFKVYVEQNPEFIESIRTRNNTFVTSQELLEKVAFEEFKSLSLEN